MSNLFEQEAGPQPPRIVKSPIETLALLKTLQQARSQVILSFPERPRTFQSFVVAVDSQSRMLWLDEMIPNDGDRYVAQGEALKVDTWIDGVHVRWECTSAEKVMLEGATAYLTSIPLEMIYHQKRGAFRALVHRSLETGIGLTHGKRGTTTSGHLVDISATGCRARLSGDQTAILKPGEIFEPSYLELPESGRVAVAIEIRHVAYDETADESLAGLQFKRIVPLAQRQIDRFVNLLQREARRLEKDDLF